MSPTANRREVTDAFRRFALTHHPDRGGDPARFQAGVDAYHHLTGSRPPSSAAQGTVVFHRRSRPAVSTLLRMAGRRLAAFRLRP